MANALGVNPWVEMWLRPRQTLRAVLNFNPQHRLYWLSTLYGLPLLLNMAQSFSLAERFSALGILLIAVIFSFLVGIVGISISSGLIFWTGRWIGGGASFDEVRAAVAWSNVTNVVNVCIWAVLLVLFGNEVFLSSFPQKVFTGYQAVLVFLIFLAQAVVAVWSFVILITGLSEAQGFSAWKAILNLVIPFLIVFVVLWGLGWVMSSSQVSIQ